MTGIRFVEQNPASAEFDRQTEIRRREDQRQIENERVETDREDEMTRTALTALAAGDMATFNEFGKRVGLTDTLPPQAIQDAETRQRIGMGGLIADATYADEDQQALFMQNYLQNGGDEAAAAAATGEPRRPGRGGRRRNEGVIETVMRNGREVKVLVDQITGETTVIGEAPASTGVSGRTLNQNQLADLRIRAEERAQANAGLGWSDLSLEEQRERVEEQMQYLVSPIGGGGTGQQQWAYEAEGPDGSVVVSNDGQTWYNMDGRRVQ